MTLGHNPWLVALSLLVAIQGAYVGLRLAREFIERRDHRRRLLAASAASLAAAVWSMHFIGMLAAVLPFAADYLVLPTLLSGLICALFVGASTYFVSLNRNSPAAQAVAAVVMGSGIVAMHSTGMMALHAQAVIIYDPRYVVASWIVGVTASLLALRFAFADTKRPPMAVAATALGLAISGMHYTAMAGTLCTAGPQPASWETMSLNSDAMAVVVALAAFTLSSVFLLRLVPDVLPGPQLAKEAGTHVLTSMESTSGATPTAAEKLRAADALSALADAAALGLLPRTGPEQESVPSPAVLPVQHHGATKFVPVASIHAIKADAHYTWVFDGRASYLCGWSITEAESRLDPQRFARVHRSHIVALDKIATLRKAGDGALAELSSDAPYSLPISRRRVATVRAAMAARV
jgi:diguanylate cyclase